MKPLNRILSFLLIGIFILACEDEQQTWLSEMEGTLDCTVPAVIGKGLPVTIAAGGIVTPSNVAYSWKTPEFSSKTFTGTTFEAMAPPVAGEYPIFVTAHAAGYRDVTIKKTITVVECAPMQGHLGIGMPADVVRGEEVQFIAKGITSPTEENVTYEWHAQTGFTPERESYTGSTVFETKAPNDPGSYTITVTASAENYCKISFDTTILVKPGRKMQGLFDFTFSETIIKGQKVTFTARGITTPSAEKIRYEWTAPGFTGGTPSPSGNSYTAVCPPNTGTYAVEVTARADGYSDSTIKRDIVVVNEWDMTGYLIIAPPPEIIKSKLVTFEVINHISSPREGISFKWDAPHFSPSTHLSPDLTFTTTAPSTVGNYTITVTAIAAQYSDESAGATAAVKEGLNITGTLFDFDVPNETVKDLEATFTVKSNLSTADGTPIRYEWDAPGFTPTTFTGSTFTSIPKTPGPRTITLYAKANGYITKSASNPINVIEGRDMGTLTISADGGQLSAGDNTVTFTPLFTPGPPTSSVSYTWHATSFTPSSSSENQFNPILPSKAGTYTITLTAKATGYHPKTATATYTIACRPMEVGFTSSRAALLTNDETTLNVNPPSPPVSGISYTWVIPTGFDVKAGTGGLTTPSVTIKTPNQPREEAVPIKLTATAVNYCPATYSKNVTVKECYDLPNLPVITALGESNEFVSVPSRRNVTFSTPEVVPLRAGGTTTYNWQFQPSSSSPFTPPSSNGSNTFTTAAPEPNSETYTLNLTVTADGYCPHAPVNKRVVVTPHTDQLRGKIIVKEAIKSTDPSVNQDSTVWIAKDHAATLTAVYIPAAGENDLKLTFTWKWLETSQSVSHNLSPNRYHDTIGFTPTASISDGWLVIEVADYNGKAPITKTYPYTVQDCIYTGTDLYINVNYKCGTTNGAGNYTAFIKDAKDDKKYPIAQIQNMWWFTENLKRNVGSHQESPLGFFYSKNESASTDICPTGWRIPTGGDWTNLAKIASSNQDQFKQLIINKTTDAPYDGTAWAKYANTPGDNRYGFSAIPAGYYYGSTSTSQGILAYFLTNGAIVYHLGDNTGVPVNSGYGILSQTTPPADSYYNVRCVRDYP
jgi:uncharacterized protein (TIGR02145 family)